MRPLTLAMPLAALLVAGLAPTTVIDGAAAPAGAALAALSACRRVDPPAACMDQTRSRGAAAENGALARPPFDSTSHSWLSDRVLLLYRRAGLVDEERALWLLASGGVDALVAEALASGNSGLHARFFQIAIEDPAADAERVARLLDAGLPAASSARATVLLSIGEWMRAQRWVDPAVFHGHLAATRGLATGSARHRVLADLLAVPALNDRQLAHAIRAVEAVSSRSAARADLLIVAATGRQLEPKARAAYVQVASVIGVRGHRLRAQAALR